jgi:phosphatidylserine/phosphatidylglycerophosphate/cardiolipin synthase-like enzyme
LIASAKHSIFISQQDLLSCLPTKATPTEAKFDERAIAALANRIKAGIPVKIVVSPKVGGGYSNGWTLQDVADVLVGALEKDEGLSEAAAKGKVCQGVGLASIRNAVFAANWRDKKSFTNHAKVVAVDDQAFYIGSGNLYPGGLQELGLIVDDRQVAAHFKKAYLDPLWTNSRLDALIDPQKRVCPWESSGPPV